MEFNNQKLLKGHNDDISEVEDRISKLPDSVLHYILSFHGTRFCARTSVLSKRWNHIWTCIPTLDFLTWDHSDQSSLSRDKFMEFVDRTLLLHETSNIQKFCLDTDEQFNASQVHSWITRITRLGVQELSLSLDLDKPFLIPASLFTCETLVKLDLSASSAIHFPESFSFPKLKSLEIFGIRFTGDNCWNEQPFFSFPVLEKLILRDCTWVGVTKFCILCPALKDLRITNGTSREGLQDCDLKIYAPTLASLYYLGDVAKDYDLSIFKTLDEAEVSYYYNYYDARSEQWIAVTKLFRAISYVQSLMIDIGSLQLIFDEDDFTNALPTFHNLNELDLHDGGATDKLVFALLKAAPNLKKLEFCSSVFDIDYDDYDDHDHGDDNIIYDETEDLFQHLQSVIFRGFCGEERELRWAKIILMNAKYLQAMTIAFCSRAENKLIVTSELLSLPRASGSCVFEFV